MHFRTIDKLLLSSRKPEFIGDNFSYKKFMIITQGRSASRFLVKNLNSNDNILCYGEIFKPNFLEWERFPFREKELPCNDIALDIRIKKPIDFLEKLIYGPYNEKYKAIGFKILYYQYYDLPNWSKQKIINWLLKNDVHIIQLTRKNTLKIFVSMEIAGLQKKWHTDEIGFRQTKTININLKNLSSYLTHMEEVKKYFELTLNGSPIIKIDYDDLIDSTQKTMEQIQTFLDVPVVETNSNLVKMEHRPLQNIIQNYEEVHNFLKPTKWGHFLED